MRMTEARLPVRLWAIFAIAFVIFLSGCGSGLPDPPPDKRPSDSDESKPVKPPPPPKKVPPPSPPGNEYDDEYRPPKPQSTKAKPNPVNTDDGDGSGQYHSEVSSLPADLSRWNGPDFLLARDKGDTRLVAAVEQLAKHPQGTAVEAEMLASLLKPQSSARPEALAAPARGALVRAVTAALAANNTDAAGKTLCDLFSGEFSATQRQAVVDVALTALLRQASPESDRAVLRLLTAPLHAAASDQDQQPSDALRQKMISIVRAGASEQLRKMLAIAIIDRTAPVALPKDFLSVLCEPHPLNLEAQVLIYQSELADAATRAALEKLFASAGREALQTFLGFPAQQPASPPPAPDLHYNIGAQLWGPPFTDFLNLQHQALTTLVERPSSLALAAAIPSAPMRANLQRTLSRHWAEGPQAIRAMGAADKGLVEPGFLAVLKSLARENRVKSSQPLRPARPIKQSYDPEQDFDERPKSTFETDWNKLIEDLVRDYCRRCHMAALARVAAAYRSGADPSLDARATDSPIPLYPNSTVAAAYRFNWPDEHASRLPQLADDALQIYYQRIEERTKPARLVTYYHRQVKSCIEHSLSDGMWLDGLIEIKKEDRTRSIDVLITRANTGSSPPANEEQELTVEILSIEVRKLHE